MTTKFLIRYTRAPGDVLLLTGLIRDLRLNYGDQYAVGVDAAYSDLWRHNPYLSQFDGKDASVRRLEFGGASPQAVDRRGIHWSQHGEGLHYLSVFHRHFQALTGIPVPVRLPRPDLHLTEEERTQPYVSGPYWVVVPGGKLDMTNKIWHQHRWQEVVDGLRRWGRGCVQEGTDKPLHVHLPLKGVLNMVGRSSIRDLIRNIQHAEGVICGVTLQMHIAAALEKPCVVIAGGREEPAYEWYGSNCCQFDRQFGPQCSPVTVPHRFLHTMGQLPCCQTRGCWRRRIVALRDGRQSFNRPQTLCVAPHQEPGLPPVPECLHRIRTEDVLAAVTSYFRGPLPAPFDVTPPPELLRETELMQRLRNNKAGGSPPVRVR